MKPKPRPVTPVSIDDYLRTVAAPQRKALRSLRDAIRAAAPAAVECIGYGIPGFRLNGKLLVSFAGAVKHCAFHLGSTTREFRSELNGYGLGKGTIRFQPQQPLDGRLVRRMVRARIDGNARFRPAN
ncbi:MAG TPA: DUF1801 domain-containing protein [Candidatus Didemnitutus sp.]